jgi:hypothetical protein
MAEGDPWNQGPQAASEKSGMEGRVEAESGSKTRQDKCAHNW